MSFTLFNENSLSVNLYHDRCQNFRKKSLFCLFGFFFLNCNGNTADNDITRFHKRGEWSCFFISRPSFRQRDEFLPGNNPSTSRRLPLKKMPLCKNKHCSPALQKRPQSNFSINLKPASVLIKLTESCLYVQSTSVDTPHNFSDMSLQSSRGKMSPGVLTNLPLWPTWQIYHCWCVWRLATEQKEELPL